MDFLKKELEKRMADVECFNTHERAVANHRLEIAKHEAEIAKHEAEMEAINVKALLAEIEEITSICKMIDELRSAAETPAVADPAPAAEPAETEKAPATELAPIIEETVNPDLFNFSSVLMG